MTIYLYEEAVYNDTKNYIEDNYSVQELQALDFETAYEQLYDELWTADSVTGNGSGSYTFSTYRAEENLCHNLTLLAEACNEFGCDMSEMLANQRFEEADVTIRCYLLGQFLSEILEDIIIQ